jgi:Rrf2 family protein
MHILAQEEYGLRCLLQVAQHEGDDPLTIQAISAREGLSPEYTAKIMRTLRQAGLVHSTRGASGGYRLARAPEEITAWEVIRAIGGSFFPDEFCDTHPGQRRDCVHTTRCSIRGLWGALEDAVRGVLEKVTLEDLRRDEKDLAGWLQESDLLPIVDHGAGGPPR